MRLFEFANKDNNEEIYNAEKDFTVLSSNDTRKTRFTLEHLNRIRKTREAKQRELAEKVKLVQKQYKQPTESL